jgi:hypothetical protein
MTIADAGRLVLKHIPRARAEFVDGVDDTRDYRVSFAKLRKALGITPSVSVEDGIKEMRDYLIASQARAYSDSKFSNVKQTEKILNERQNSFGRDGIQTSTTLVASPRQILGRVANS